VTILLADDNAKMRRTIAVILSDLPATFYECGDGDEAIESKTLSRCR